MLTETEEVTALACTEINKLDVPYSDSDYPPEVIERWMKESDIVIEKFKRGEIKSQTLREAAAEHGIIL
jgi:hypothetical protein